MTAIGLPNGRDPGGLAASGGGAVRPGLLLRSAAPTSPSQSAAVGHLGVRQVIDLRTAAERQQRPSLLPDNVRRIAADVLADAAHAGAANLGLLAAQALDGERLGSSLPGRDLRSVMLRSYRDFALLGSARAGVGQVLRLLADDQAGPVLIHCTAGKDRTGFLMAVVLHLLGVSERDILADYLRSGPEVAAMFAPLAEALPDPERALQWLQPLLGVEPAYLDAGLGAAADRYGSLEAYVRDGLAVDDATVAALRARLVSRSRGQSIAASAAR